MLKIVIPVKHDLIDAMKYEADFVNWDDVSPAEKKILGKDLADFLCDHLPAATWNSMIERARYLDE